MIGSCDCIGLTRIIGVFRIMCPTMDAEVWSNIDISPSLMLNRLNAGSLMKMASHEDRGKRQWIKIVIIKVTSGKKGAHECPT